MPWSVSKFCTEFGSYVVVCGCETLSFTVREEHRLRVVESSVLRKLFGPMRDEVTGEWRTLHEERI
jgi:hypothetical protein